MLFFGLPFNDMLELVRRDPTKSESMKAISRSDLRKISTGFGISHKCVSRQNDAQNLAAWGELMRNKKLTANLIQYVKFQRQEDSESLKSENFLIVMMPN